MTRRSSRYVQFPTADTLLKIAGAAFRLADMLDAALTRDEMPYLFLPVLDLDRRLNPLRKQHFGTVRWDMRVNLALSRIEGCQNTVLESLRMAELSGGGQGTYSRAQWSESEWAATMASLSPVIGKLADAATRLHRHALAGAVDTAQEMRDDPAESSRAPTRMEPPRVYLTSWREIVVALELDYNDGNRDKVRKLNDHFNGPILIPGRGAQPKVEKGTLLDWSALSDKMPILPTLNHAFRVTALHTCGHCRILPAHNARDANRLFRYADVTPYREKPCDTDFRLLWPIGRATRNSTNRPVAGWNNR